MSIVSNHFPEVIDELNGIQEGRPSEWDRLPTDEEIDAMAALCVQDPFASLDAETRRYFGADLETYARFNPHWLVQSAEQCKGQGDLRGARAHWQLAKWLFEDGETTGMAA